MNLGRRNGKQEELGARSSSFSIIYTVINAGHLVFLGVLSSTCIIYLFVLSLPNKP